MDQNNDDLLEVLRFYADEDNYREMPFGHVMYSPIEHDRGHMARLVLEKVEEKIDNS